MSTQYLDRKFSLLQKEFIDYNTEYDLDSFISYIKFAERHAVLEDIDSTRDFRIVIEGERGVFDIVMKYRSLETNREYNIRKQKEEAKRAKENKTEEEKKARREAKERKLYEKLKEKFGDT